MYEKTISEEKNALLTPYILIKIVILLREVPVVLI